MATYFGMTKYGNLFWQEKWQLILACQIMATYFGMPNYGNLFVKKMATYFGMPNYGSLFWHENVLTEWQEKLHFLKYAKFQNRVRVL